MAKHPSISPASQPDPRPNIRIKSHDSGINMDIFVPIWCLDNQSFELTHDQLKHLTGRVLSDAMKARRRQLEAPPRG